MYCFHVLNPLYLYQFDRLKMFTQAYWPTVFYKIPIAYKLLFLLPAAAFDVLLAAVLLVLFDVVDVMCFQATACLFRFFKLIKRLL